ncbi:hypothetical protein DH2020_044206 [Rehmannia glutinosa]|uniref:Anthranilate synthase n=1 Tax=Rehmannia glutinosa TaxID=99300 RepID=A0ABR0UHK7_REHGL
MEVELESECNASASFNIPHCPSPAIPRVSPASAAGIYRRNWSSSVALRLGTFQRCASKSSSLVVDEKRFLEASENGNVIPLYKCIFSDHLTPVLAYDAWLKKTIERLRASFLSLSSLVFVRQMFVVGAQPAMEVVAKENKDPGLDIIGGWVGFFSYDTVRYVERKSCHSQMHQKDDRNLADIHLGLYDDVIVFDHVDKAYDDGIKRLETLVSKVQDIDPPRLSPGCIDFCTRDFGLSLDKSNLTSEEYMKAVLQAKEHILAGDIFQIVLSQRFERRTFADPFEVYRALRVVNPSPYMSYLQARGCILVASSPEILTRVKEEKIVNRPLAGTTRRGKTLHEDEMLEMKLLKDEKQCAEHIMLVDLGRNDVGKVKVEKLMTVERYSHVMHISSTVTGELLDHLTGWDALTAALPVGTVSGAPKLIEGEGYGVDRPIRSNKKKDHIVVSFRHNVLRTGTATGVENGRTPPIRAGIVATAFPGDEQLESDIKLLVSLVPLI